MLLRLILNLFFYSCIKLKVMVQVLLSYLTECLQIKDPHTVLWYTNQTEYLQKVCHIFLATNPPQVHIPLLRFYHWHTYILYRGFYWEYFYNDVFFLVQNDDKLRICDKDLKVKPVVSLYKNHSKSLTH